MAKEIRKPIAKVQLPVDGVLVTAEFFVTGFHALYAGLRAVDVEALVSHDSALADKWKKANQERRDALELEFKLGPIVAPYVVPGKTVNGTLFSVSAPAVKPAKESDPEKTEK